MEAAAKKVQARSGRYKERDDVDQWLDSKGYYRKHTARDATCLYRAIAEQIFLTQAVHSDVKRQILDFIAWHPTLFEKIIEKDRMVYYVGRMRTAKDWGGLPEIYAAAMLYKRRIFIWHDVGNHPTIVEPKYAEDLDPEKCIQLCRSHERHYDSVYTKEYISDSAFCQSLVYESLYKNVFKLEEVDYAVNKMLHDKDGSKTNSEGVSSSVHPVQQHGYEDLRLEMRDCLSNVKDLLDVGIIPFPYKVAKSLDKDIYRNVEFDVWNDYRKGLRYGLYEWSCKELQVGVKCYVRLEGDRKCIGHVQEMSPNRGPVVVFIVELGQKISVPYDSLELVPPSPSQKTQAPPPARPSTLAIGTPLKYSNSGDSHSQEPTGSHQVTSPGCYNDHESHVRSDSYQEGCESEMLPDSSTGKVLYITYPENGRVPVGGVREIDPRPDPGEVPLHYPVMPVTHVERVRRNAVAPGSGYGSYVMGGGYLMPPYEMSPQPAYEMLTPITPVNPIAALPPSAMETVLQPEPVDIGLRELGCPEVPIGPQIVPTGRVMMSQGAGDVYEGQPLIQQYEVSSSTGPGMNGRPRLPPPVPIPTSLTPAPLAPAPLTPVYYQPVDLCDHHYYPPPIYVDHFVVSQYPHPTPYPTPYQFAYPPPDHVCYQANPHNAAQN